MGLGVFGGWGSGWVELVGGGGRLCGLGSVWVGGG